MAGNILGDGFDVIKLIKDAVDGIGDKFNAGLGMVNNALGGALLTNMGSGEQEGLVIHAEPLQPLIENFNNIESHHIEAALAAIHPITKSFNEPQHAMLDLDNALSMQLPTPQTIPNVPGLQQQPGFSLA